MADFFAEKIPKVFTFFYGILYKAPDSAPYVLNRALFTQISKPNKKEFILLRHIRPTLYHLGFTQKHESEMVKNGYLYIKTTGSNICKYHSC